MPQYGVNEVHLQVFYGMLHANIIHYKFKLVFQDHLEGDRQEEKQELQQKQFAY